MRDLRPERLLPFAALLSALFLNACGGASDGTIQNGILVTLDTTRVDAVGFLTGPAGASPHLNSLAEESVNYEQARTVAPLTLPSHSSMLTGLYPMRHRARVNYSHLPQSAETTAERLRTLGFQTAAFVGSAVLDARTGINQGFEVFDQPLLAPFQQAQTSVEISASNVTANCLRWLRARDRSRRFFLWVHYFDPHFPYAPRAQFLEQVGTSRTDFRTQYYAEIATADSAFQRVWAELEEQDVLDETIVIVAADHGEGFGDHGEQSHGVLCYDEVLRVPFFIRYPDGFRAGERSQELVTVADIHPTFLEALGAGAPLNPDGMSLFKHEVDPDRGIYFESFVGFLSYGQSPITGWLNARGKYLHSSIPELYDVGNDHGEALNLLGRNPELAEPFVQALRRQLDRPGLLRAEESGELSPEQLDALRKMGYVGTPADNRDLPDPLAVDHLIAPPAGMKKLEEMQRHLQAAQDKDYETALTGLLEIVNTNPLNTTALYELAKVFVQLQRYPEALEPLRECIRLGDGWYGVHYLLGASLDQLGLEQEAVRELERALELNPTMISALTLLIAVHERAGREAEAQAWRDKKQELVELSRRYVPSGAPQR